MNTKYYFDRRLVLTISVLFTTLWLPLTTAALDFTEASALQNIRECEASTDVLTAKTLLNARSLEKEFGFSETDPTDNQSQHSAITLRSPKDLHQQAYAGFSEIDPAYQQSNNIETVMSASNIRAHVNAGFSETDPAANMYKSTGEIDQQALAGCLDGNAKGAVLETPKLSSLAIKNNHHGHS